MKATKFHFHSSTKTTNCFSSGCGKFPYPKVRFQKYLPFKRRGPRQPEIIILDCAITTRGNFLIRFKTKRSRILCSEGKFVKTCDVVALVL